MRVRCRMYVSLSSCVCAAIVMRISLGFSLRIGHEIGIGIRIGLSLRRRASMRVLCL